MSQLIFSSQLRSLNGSLYKVELTGENYIGLDTAIVGGSGNDWEVSTDWTDYLVNLQNITLTDTGVGTQAAIVQSFSYNSGTDKTTIELDFAFDSDFDQITNDDFFPVFAPDVISLETTWEGENDIILQALKPSSTLLTYANPKDSAFFDRFFELFLIVDDDELKVQIFKDNTGFELEWVGNLVHDLMEYDNVSKPRPYTFKVIDGIDMLKDIPYAEALTGASEQPLISHIITLLGYINTSQFWGGSDAYIRESIEYTSNEVPGLAIDDSSLEYAFLDDRHFIERKAQDINEPLDVYTALVAILELMSCRLFLAQGVWWVQQIRNYDNPTSVVYREFTTSIGAASSQSQYNHKLTVGGSDRAEDLVIMARGKFRYLPGLLNSKIIANKANEIYTDTDNSILTVTDSTILTSRTYDLGHVYGGVGTGANMRIEFLVEELANSRTGYNLKCELEIFVNNRYIKGGDSIDPFWGDDAVQIDRFWFKRVHETSAGNRTKVIFETPEIPFSEDGVTLKLSFRYRGNFSPSSGERFFSIFNPKIFFPDDENPEEINVGNPNSNFTKEMDLGELIIDDINRFTSISTLLVDDEFTTASPRNLIEAETWDADFDTDDSLAVTRVTEAMSLQFRPIETIQARIEGTLYGFNSLSYNDKVYVFNGFAYNYLVDEYQGTWFEIATARSSIAIDQTIKKFPEGTKVPDTSGEGKGWANNSRNNLTGLTTTTPTPAGSITSINIAQTGHERIKNGDTIQVIHPVTNSVFATFVVTADVNAGDTTISVSSESIEFDITEEMVIIFKKGEVVEANIIRADTFIDKTSGLEIGKPTGSDLEIQFNDNGAFGASSDFTWDDSLKELVVAGDILLGDNDRINFGDSLNSYIHFDGSESVWVATTENIRLNSEGATEAIQFKVGTQTTATSVLFMDSTNAQLTRYFGDGSIRNFKYGGGARTAGAATFMAAWDADGNLIEETLPSGGGDVTKVGTPVNNEIGVWTGDGTIEGDSLLTWDGLDFGVDGKIKALGQNFANHYVQFSEEGTSSTRPRAIFELGGGTANNALWIRPDSSSQRSIFMEVLTSNDVTTADTKRLGLWQDTGKSVIGSSSGTGSNNGTSLYFKTKSALSTTTNYAIRILAASTQVDFPGNVGIGTNSPAIKLHITDTTQQLRIGYDSLNYFSTTVDSLGSTAFNLVGTVPEFTFNKTVTMAQNLTVDGDVFLSNLPTSDPSVSGQLWNDSGTVKVS